jgi:hypothetical protein
VKTSSKNSAPHASARLPQREIDAANWESKALAFMGGADGFVIRNVEGEKGEYFTHKPATDAQWIAWFRWFDRKKIPCEFIRKFGVATVPCEWPEGFDADMMMLSDHSLTLERPAPAMEQAGRRLPDWLRPKDLVEAGRVSRPRPPLAEALSTLDGLADRYRAAPLAPSSDLAARFAAPREEPQF